MRTGDRVKTESHGTGIILTQKYIKGAISERYLVKLDNCPDRFKDLHIRPGGLYFWKCELLTIKKDE